MADNKLPSLAHLRQALARCAALVNRAYAELAQGKQDIITGTPGQVVGFNSQGKPVAQAASGITQTAADGRYLRLTGGTLTGALTLAGSPTATNQAANKQYVDTVGGTCLKLAGGTMTGRLILMASSPTSAYHAAHKQYVDNTVNAAIGSVNSLLDRINGEVI